MFATRAENASRPGGLWSSMLHLLVEDVPEELALCEFECRRCDCTWGQWLTCERRLQSQKPCPPAPVPSEAALHASA